MRDLKSLSPTDRWSWFAAGDETIAPSLRLSPRSKGNSAQRVLWEVGWALAMPLALAVLLQLVLSP